MKRERLTILLCCVVILLPVAEAAVAAIPVPSGMQATSYEPVSSPFLGDDPASIRPVGVGLIGEGDNVLRLQVGLNGFSGPVDLYFALYLPILDSGTIFLVRPDSSIAPLSEGLVPWRSGVTGPVNETLYGDILRTVLPRGTYSVALMATPQGRRDEYHLWITQFFVGGWKYEDVENTILTAFGEDGGFDAVMLAGEKGYSFKQIIEAAVTGRLKPDGRIMWYGDGSAEPPKNQPLGLIVEAGVAKAAGGEYIETPITVEHLRNMCKAFGGRLGLRIMVVLVPLLNRGYSAEQVIEAILLDNVVYREYPDPGDSGVTLRELAICDSYGKRQSPSPAAQADGAARTLEAAGACANGVLQPMEEQYVVIQAPLMSADMEGPGSLTLAAGEAAGTWNIKLKGGMPPYSILADCLKGGQPCGEKSFSTNLQSSSVTFSFVETGNFILRLRVTDAEGALKLRSVNVEVKEVEEGLPFTRCVVYVTGLPVTYHYRDWSSPFLDPIEKDVTFTKTFDFIGTGSFTGDRYYGAIDKGRYSCADRCSVSGGFVDVTLGGTAVSVANAEILWGAYASHPDYSEKNAMTVQGLTMESYDQPGLRGTATGPAACSYITALSSEYSSYPKTLYKYKSHSCTESTRLYVDCFTPR